MFADLTAGQNSRIYVFSPSGKIYELNAYSEIYGNRHAVGKHIPLMSLNAETDGIVEHEDGEFQVYATTEFPLYRLSSEPQKLILS